MLLFCVQWVKTRKIVARLVFIGEIVDHHYLSFLFISNKKHAQFLSFALCFTAIEKFLYSLLVGFLNVTVINASYAFFAFSFRSVDSLARYHGFSLSFLLQNIKYGLLRKTKSKTKKYYLHLRRGRGKHSFIYYYSPLYTYLT
jgi:hypothetical protein